MEKVNRFKFEAKWGDYKFSGIQTFADQPSQRDTQYIHFDVQDMMGYVPDDLTVTWSPVGESRLPAM